MSAASLGKDSEERPWKERVQSTWRAPSSRRTGWSERPFVRSGRGVVGSVGAWRWVLCSVLSVRRTIGRD